jgi:glycerol-3-phosphate dehydrogenase (NAD(P)+)
MSQMQYPVGVIGGGAWGTALAAVMAQIHDRVLIWAREEETVQSINNRHEIACFCPVQDCHQKLRRQLTSPA